MNIDELAREGARAAIDVRRRLQVERTAPLCPLNSAEKLGVQVRLMALPSAEGIYCGDRGPTIIVSTERPPGRQNFTCAHEIGHHEFGHGTRSDEYLPDREKRTRFDPDEFLADVFAGHFLMPAGAVREGFARRNVVAGNASEQDVFAVAGWLGVGYDTLVTHMEVGLQMISADKSSLLRRWTPKALRKALVGTNDIPHLIVAGLEWHGRPIDLRVGDGVLLPPGTVAEGNKLELKSVGDQQVMAIATGAGLSRLEVLNAGWSCFVRVMKRDYEGLSQFRFEEEDDDEHDFASHDRW